MQSFNPVFFGDTDLMNLIWYAFVVFFAGLIFYIQRESRREGYPLESDTDGSMIFPTGAFYVPPRKEYHLPNGDVAVQPNFVRDDRPIAAKPMDPNPGAPLEPTGDPMVDGFGPAAYAERANHPDMTHDGQPKIVPMRAAPDFTVAEGDRDPRGFEVIGMHARDVAGKVSDIWVDRGEQIIRYYEVETKGGRKVLIPMPLADVKSSQGRVQVRALTAEHFEKIPTTAKPDEITMLEEDKISAFVGSGYLYAVPSRREPLI